MASNNFQKEINVVTRRDVDPRLARNKPSTSKDALEENNDGPKQTSQKKKPIKIKNPKKVAQGKALAEKLKEMKQQCLIRARQSKSQKSGLVFPVNRVLKHLKKMFRHHRITEATAVFLTGVIEYMTAEILDLAGNSVIQNNRHRIKPRDILLAIRADVELNKLLDNVIVSSGGVTPFIHQVLLKNKKEIATAAKKKKRQQHEEEEEEEEQEEEVEENAETGEEESTEAPASVIEETQEHVVPATTAEHEFIRVSEAEAQTEPQVVQAVRKSLKRKLPEVEEEKNKVVNLDPELLTSFTQEDQRAIKKYFKEVNRNSLNVEAKIPDEEAITAMTPSTKSNDVSAIESSGGELEKEKQGEHVQQQPQTSSDSVLDEFIEEEIYPAQSEINETIEVPVSEEFDNIEAPSLSPILTNIINYEAYYKIETSKQKRFSLDSKENQQPESSKKIN